MTNQNGTLWTIQPHSKAKHEILRRYLASWFPILGSRIPRIVYIDGFCGPGKYLGGERGSPIIAIDEAIKQPVLQRTEVHFLFIDERPDRIAHLKNELSGRRLPPNFHIHCEVNEFENTLTGVLDELQREGSHLAPTFAFIDPFGFRGAPFSLVKRLLNNPRTEIFINIMVESVNRFVDSPTTAIRQHIKALLGASDGEIKAILDSPNRVEAFRQLYQKRLQENARFVRYFEMVDERNKVIYYSFFAGNNRLGHAKMKEAFWMVDRQSGYRFSDRTNPNQPVLFDFDPSADLAKHLKQQFIGSTQGAEDVIRYVEDETAYIAAHARGALCLLESNGRISVDALKSDGKRRRRNSFPTGTAIHFIPDIEH